MENKPVLLNITHQLECLKSELSSDKITIRNKAVERLDEFLNTSQLELIEIFSNDIYKMKWCDFYGIIIEGIIKQSEKLNESKNNRNFQTLLNKNQFHSTVMLKLVNYSLQGHLEKRISASHIYQGISLIFENRIAREYFGILCLQIIDNYFFNDSLHISNSIGELKPNDFVKLIDYIVKIINTNQKSRKLGLKMLCNSLEASIKYFQLKQYFINYLLDIKNFTNFAIECNDYKDTVIKINLIIIRTFCIDYYKIIRDYLLSGVISKLCKLYEFHLKVQSKLDLFEIFELSFILYYPKLKLNGNLETKISSPTTEWRKIIQNYLSIFDIEKKEFYKSKDAWELSDNFLEFSASVLYVTYYNQSLPKTSSTDDSGASSSKSKIQRHSSCLESIITFISNTLHIKFCFPILVKLLSRVPSLINESDLQTLIQLNIDIIKKNVDCKMSIRNVISLSEIILKYEILCDHKELISNSLIENSWLKLVDSIIVNNQHCEFENNVLLKVLISYKKLNIKTCKHLIKQFSHDLETLKRCDKLGILREILINYGTNTNILEPDFIKKLIEFLYSYKGDNLLTSESLNLLAEISTTLVLNNYEKINFEEFDNMSDNMNEYKNKHILSMIELLHLEKFIAIESRLKYDISPKSNITTNYLNEYNFDILIENLNYVPISDEQENDINDNIVKLQKIILLNLKFTKMNVADNNTEVCPIKKKFLVLFNQIELQLTSLQINTTELNFLIKTFTNLLNFFKLLRHSSLKRNLTEVNCNNIINFIKKISTKANLNTEDHSELHKLEHLSIEIFAIITSTFNNDNTFSFIERYDFSTKDFTLINNVLKYFYESENIKYAYGEWIIEEIKLICQKYSTNVDVSIRFLDILKPLFLLLKPYDDLIEDLFIILSSFQQITYKMRFSEEFTTKLLILCRDISKAYSKLIISDTSIQQCFLDIGKFLNKPSLIIQFSVIECIGYLMDPKWMVHDEVISKEYINFTNELYNTIDWQKWTIDMNDTKCNINSVLIQFFMQLFSFGYDESNIAFCELIKLSSSSDSIEWCNIKQFNNYFHNCDNFMYNLLENLISFYLKNNYELKKIPWYFYEKTEFEFFESHFNKLVFYGLKYLTPEKIKTLIQKFPKGLKQESIYKDCVTFLMPFTMNTNNNNLSLTYKQECNIMTKNLFEIFQKKFESIEIKKKFNEISESYWLANLTQNLYDDDKFNELIGFKLHLNNVQYYFNFHQFQEIVKFNLNKLNNNIFDEIFISKPIEIIKYLKILKDNIYNSIFLWNQLLNLSRYYTALDLLLPTIKKNLNCNINEYFVKDILNFTIDLLNKYKTENILYYAIINYTEKILMTFLDINGIERFFMNPIILITENLENLSVESKNLFRKSLTILENIFCQIIEKSNVYLKLIEPLMKKDVFLNTSIEKKTSTSENHKSIDSTIQDFIKQPNNLGIENLKNSIFENKSQFLQIMKENNTILPKLMGKITNIIIDDKLEDAIKATECLGLIGPIYIQKYAFTTVENDNLLYEEIYFTNFESFRKNTIAIVEKLIFEENYEPTKYKFLNSICEFLANNGIFSKHGEVNYLEAFTKKSNKKIAYNEFELQEEINFLQFLRTNECLSYEIFLCNFTELIFEKMNYTHFRDLSKIQFEFSQAIIIPLINYLLITCREFKKYLIELLDYFFKEAVDAVLIKNYKKIYKDKKAIKCFLDFTECLRLTNDHKLPINLLNVAKVAANQQAHFLAALFLEIWAEEEIEKSNYKKTMIELRENQEFQEIATIVYKAIGCTDDINCFLNPITSRLDFHGNCNNWLDILTTLDATNSYNENSRLIMENIKQRGLFELAKIVNKHNADYPTDYEVCWRLSQWESFVPKEEKETCYFKDSLNIMEHQLEKYHFLTLKSIYEKDKTSALRSIKKGREVIVNIFKESSIECIQNLYKHLTNMMLLQHAEEFMMIQFPSETSKNSIELFLNNWKLENHMEFGNFINKERVNAHRIILFESAGLRAKRKIEDYYKDDNIIANTLLQMINDCKINSNFEVTKRYLEKLKSIKNCSSEIVAHANLVDAEICWMTNQKLIAKKILKNLMVMKESNVVLQRIEAFHLYGKYVNETNDEPFEDVHSKYLMKSTELTSKVNNAINTKKLILNCTDFQNFHQKMIAKNYNLIAKFADNEYLQIDRHINSEIFRTTVRLKDENLKDADKLKLKAMSDRESRIHYEFKKQTSKIDETEIKYFQDKHSEYLVLAVENYMKFSIIDDSIISPAIYRLISLWLTNKQNDKVRKMFNEHLMSIGSYKFICVLSQLTAHLNNTSCEYFIKTLEKLLFRISIDHPHHSLLHIFSLKNAYHSKASTSKNDNRDTRTEIAARIIRKVANEPEYSKMIKQLERMSLAFIEFANVIVDPKQVNDIKISTKIRNLINLDKIHCPTKPLEIKRDKNYKITHILNWSEAVKFAGGVNMPKRLFCNCSDGKTYQQLLKGNDDLRQDAVMQQIFSFVNELLLQNNGDYNLKLRTYEIKPLSKTTGILEWCVNTLPIGNYLVGEKKNGGAHVKYHPNDLKLMECMELLKEFPISKPKERLEQFEYICSKYHPVFQYFFFEKYRSPGNWFEHRIRYMNSVASSSMVGFILGLGDRHCQNILIDEQTAEVVHIDFGIAFERGKTMPTPETVPFRLTRDIAAPMGICHLDGIFRKSCERTLRILRENHQPFLTILEVLLYDPLYCWTVNEKFKKKNQILLDLNLCDEAEEDEQEKEKKNAIAQRALIRIQTKLEGREDMKVGSLSVENQVQKLITEAMSFKNLSKLFHGWQAFC